MGSTAATALLMMGVGVSFAILFIVWVMPPGTFRHGVGGPLRRALWRVRSSWRWLLPGVAALAFHIVAVNVIEPVMRPWWLELTGVDFTAWIVAVEDGLVLEMAHLHTRWLTIAVAWFYLVLHHSLIIVMPLFLLARGDTSLAHGYLLAVPFAYLLAQPGFLFLPIDNPTVYYDLPSRLEEAIPGVDAIFYRGTTIDNTLPSMHIALASLAFFHGRASALPRLRAFVTVYAPLVAFSIVYLQVHWFLDIAGGIAVAYAAFRVGRRWEGREKVRAWFDGRRGDEAAVDTPPASPPTP